MATEIEITLSALRRLDPITASTKVSDNNRETSRPQERMCKLEWYRNALNAERVLGV